MLLNSKQRPASEISLEEMVCPVKKPFLFLEATKNPSPSSHLGNLEGTIGLFPSSEDVLYRDESCWGRKRTTH